MVESGHNKASDSLAASSDDVAVSVRGVSKTYSLWSSPGSRLKHALLDSGRGMLPRHSALAQRLAARAARLHQEFKALDEISFDIRKGESWGFIGVNGSGKSTLLKMISGNLRPSSGRIEVDGKVALLDYSSGLHGEFTGRENIFLKAAVLGMARKETEAKFDSIVAFADIGDFIYQPVKTYSSGMQARLGFAIVAHVEADIIITDEALAVGDAFFVQKCMDYIRSFLKRGTFLFVSHSTNDVVSLCQKAIWLDNGHARKIGSAKDVAEAYLSHNAMSRSEQFIARNAGLSKFGKVALGPDASNSSEERHQTLRRQLTQPEINILSDARMPRLLKDMRLQYPNNTLARNDIAIDAFNLSSGFGVGGACIENVVFEDVEGAPLSWIVGAEMVRLRIAVQAGRSLESPIVGFQFKDRLGQTLFADTTSLISQAEPLSVRTGQSINVEFEFQMPMLPVGDYAIRIAIADGDEGDNALLHCIDSAMIVRSVTSGSRHGLVGVPMQRISISVEADEQLNAKSRLTTKS